MRILTVALLSFAGLATLAAAEPLPFLEPTVSYSGTRVISTPDGDFSQRVYWTPEKVRTETEMPGMAMINIVREDLGVMWILSPNGGMCLEQTLAETETMGLAPGAEAYTEADVDFEEVGKETVDGLATTKYKVTSTDENGTNQALFWVTEENIPVRMEIEPVAAIGPDKVVIQVQDLKTGPLPEDLFEAGMECQPMPPMPPGKSPGTP